MTIDQPSLNWCKSCFCCSKKHSRDSCQSMSENLSEAALFVEEEMMNEEITEPEINVEITQSYVDNETSNEQIENDQNQVREVVNDVQSETEEEAVTEDIDSGQDDDDEYYDSSDESLMLDQLGVLIRNEIGLNQFLDLVETPRNNPRDYRHDIDEFDIELNQEIDIREDRRAFASDGSYYDPRTGEYIRLDLSESKSSEWSEFINPQDFGFIGQDYSPMNANIWIADSGASTHMTNSLDGLVETVKCNSAVTVGDGKALICEKIGKKIGHIKTRNGKNMKVVLDKVRYIPELYCNLLSITKVMQQGYELRGDKSGMWIEKEKVKIIFDKKIRTSNGELFGVQIDSRKEKDPCLVTKELKLINVNHFHQQLGHANEAVTRSTAKYLNYTIKGKFDICTECSLAKAKQTKLNKSTEMGDIKKGEKWSFDLSTFKNDGGNSKHWLIFVDWKTKYQKSYFLKKKSDLKEAGMKFVKEMENKYRIKIKFFRCDNAGENKTFEKILNDKGYGIHFEYTSANTPQQNGIVERCFATHYGRVRAMLKTCGVGGNIRNTILAEAAQTSTLISNILSVDGESPPHVKFFGSLPRYADNLKIFGEMGVVHQGKKIRNKLEDRGIMSMFVGYSESHAGETYRMYNVKTGRVMIT